MSSQSLAFVSLLVVLAGCPLAKLDAPTGPTQQDHQKQTCEQIMATIDGVCESTRPPWPDDAIHPMVSAPDIAGLEETSGLDESCSQWMDLAAKRAPCIERLESQVEEFEQAKTDRMAQTADLAEAVRADAAYSDLIRNGYWEDKAEYAEAASVSDPPGNLRELETRYRRKRDGIQEVLTRIGLDDPEATWHELW